jgi:thiosulfate/3-mercaptopyruvate sulfurtransferase
METQMTPLPLVIDAAQLASHLDDPSLLILDLSQAEIYQQGHIPHALHVDPALLLCGTAPVPNKLPSADQLSALFSGLGLTPERQVVVYDDQMGALAGRMIWTLHCVGHRRASFLNGQLPAWIQAGQPQESTENSATPSHFRAEIDPSLIADAEYILAHLGDAGLRIWDARTEAEYRGERIVNAKKGGHIPGARWLEWTDCLISPTDTRLRPDAELLAVLRARGITPQHQVITHCQTHRRSGLTYLVARHLGFEQVRCYDGSWFEWGNCDDTPTES